MWRSHTCIEAHTRTHTHTHTCTHANTHTHTWCGLTLLMGHWKSKYCSNLKLLSAVSLFPEPEEFFILFFVSPFFAFSSFSAALFFPAALLVLDLLLSRVTLDVAHLINNKHCSVRYTCKYHCKSHAHTHACADTHTRKQAQMQKHTNEHENKHTHVHTHTQFVHTDVWVHRHTCTNTWKWAWK